MDQDNLRSEWYRQEAPVSPAPAPAAQKPPRKKHTAMKAVMIVVFVLVLIAATAWIFSDDGSDSTLSGDSVSERPTVKPSELPDGDSAPAGSDADGFADDFRDFFDDYYTTAASTITGSKLERGENGTGVTLTTVSSQGLEPLSLQEIYTACIDSVVGIRAVADGSSGSYAWGTGVVMTPDGYILTNTHVISGASSATVVLNSGREYPALLVGEDTQSDIAVLKIEASGLRAASFGSSDELQVGDEVVAIGNPLGSQLTGTMTNGIVSAINRDINVDGHVMTLIQTNTALNEGNSGGPLINRYGQVVGITNMKMVAYYTEASIEGIGFAIPTSTVKAVADQLIETGKVSGRPGLGITVGSIPVSAAEHYDLPDGLYISDVSPNCDAAEKGVRPGDVLTHVNGIPVRTTSDVLTIKDQFQVGDTLTLTIYRDGKTFDVEVELFDMNELYD